MTTFSANSGAPRTWEAARILTQRSERAFPPGPGRRRSMRLEEVRDVARISRDDPQLVAIGRGEEEEEGGLRLEGHELVPDGREDLLRRRLHDADATVDLG